MGQKKYAKSPLLYIHQPTIRTPEASMQHNYRTPKKSSGTAPEAGTSGGTGASGSMPKKKSPVRRPLKRENISKPEMNKGDEGETAGIIEPTGDDEKTDDEPKKFKDMTMRERIDYFLDKQHVPAMRCEIRTEERKYRGRIVDFQEQDVFMRVGRRKSTTKIPFDDILEIGLIGF
ncbi:CotO family spore coat protein [Virgibacillus siamensis]|uniref:CotO family spore coat protein n=1 Tax=Virgibacillus siamensis TaxID=480071 RepID=UPI000987A0BD|nr:CotO family spore coat protein [Virgibacillus siamensis]